MSTEAFWEDVVVAVVFGEDWHTVRALCVADHRSVVDVVHREGDVVGVAQAVAVRDLEGEHLRTKLVNSGREGHVLTVEHGVHEVVVVEGHLGALGHGPAQRGLCVLHVISQVGQAEGVGAGVFVLAEVNESVVSAGSIRVDHRAGTLDVNRALNAGRVAGSCHVAVVKDDVGGHGDVLNGSPVVGTGCGRLDHQVVVLLTGGRGAALVGLVHQNFRVQRTVGEVAMRQFNGHELGQALQSRRRVQGLAWVNDADVSRGFFLNDGHDVNLGWHATDATPWETKFSKRGGEVHIDVGRAQAGWTPAEEAVAVEVVGTFAVSPQHVVGAERQVVCTAETVVSDIGTTATGVEVNQHVRVGQVGVGHTEVDTIAFDVGRQEVVRAVAAHDTRHSIAGWVEGVAAVPIFIRAVDRHGFRLEGGGNVGCTLGVSGHQEETNFAGWSSTQVGGLNAHEVGFVDDSGTVNSDLGWVQRVADGGDMGVGASVHLRGCSGPGHVLDTTGSINDGQSRGCVCNTAVPSGRCVFDIHTDKARGVHWVDPNIRAADHVETGTGGTAVNVSVNRHNIGVFHRHTVVATSERSTAEHEQVAVFLANTGGVATDVRTVEGQDRVGVVAEDTDRGREAITSDGGADVAEVAVFDDNGVVAKVDGVRSGLDGHSITRGCGDTHSVRGGSASRQSNRVSTDVWSDVGTAAARGLNNADGCATVAPRVGDDEGVGTSIRVGSEWVVVGVAVERVRWPRVLGTVWLGDFNADLIAPAVGTEVHHGSLTGAERPGTTG